MYCYNPVSKTYYKCKFNSKNDLLLTFTQSPILMYLVNFIVIGLLYWILQDQETSLWDLNIRSIFSEKVTANDIGIFLAKLVIIFLLLFTILSIVSKLIALTTNNASLDNASYYMVAIPSFFIYFVVVIIMIFGYVASHKYVH